MRIQIPEPCAASWQEMNPVEKGRFCQSCSKTVIDFTKMNQEEIIGYFKSESSKGKRICGHFKKSQIEPFKLQINLKNIPFLNQKQVWFFALFICFGTFLFSCTSPDNQVLGEIELIDTVQSKEIPITIDTYSQITEEEEILGDTLYEIGEANCESEYLRGWTEIEVIGEVKADYPFEESDSIEGLMTISEDPSTPKHNEQPKSDSASIEEK